LTLYSLTVCSLKILASHSVSAAKGSIITDPHSFGDISVIANDISMAPHREAIPSPTMTMNLGTQDAVNYKKNHKKKTQSALERLKELASGSVEHHASLTRILSAKSLVYDTPKYVLPRVFRKKLLDQGTEVKIGSSCGTVKQELGRGAYGVVVLLNVDNETTETIAVKAQASADTLAWEYEMLQKVEDRVGRRWDSSRLQGVSPFAFPEPLAFVSLADGGLMSMTAASESGLNLVDLVNVHRTRLSESFPEVLALHYTARMLNHLEMLHWHGRIVHCDVKPDNWVLMSSDGIQGSELMLVDFGRAVDLSELASDGVDAMDVKLLGEASERDMMCVAMRKGRPWSFDADTFGICASAHVLLFGTHIEIEQKRDKRWMPQQRLKRYWQNDLWTALFDTLLNSDEGAYVGSRPRSLRALREKIESYLYTQRSTLEYELKKQARLLPSSRTQLNPIGRR
jgi:hypothetical protein